MSVRDLPNIDIDDEDADDVPATSDRPSAQIFLSDALLKTALGHTNLAILTSASGVAAIIEVPAAAYVKPITSAVRRICPKSHAFAVTEKKRRDLTTPSDEDLARDFGAGTPVIGISQTPNDLLPALLLHAADIRVRVGPPDAALVRRTINAVVGGRARGLADADIARLSFADICAAIRRGSTASDCVKRLQRKPQVGARIPGTKAPAIEDLPLFGDAKLWASDTLAEIERMRRGEISSGEIESTILCGEPGSGKTVLASALARSAKLPLITTSVASWFVSSDGHLGSVLQAADGFFQALRAAAPAVGFLDELEAIPDRATLEARHREWWNPVITGLLLMVSSVRAENNGVILLGATNFIDRIDAALKRPGRFGRHVLVRGPESQTEVAEVLRYYAGADLSPDEVDYASSLVGTTTPAAVEGWMASARRLARQANRALAVEDLVQQIAPPDMRSKTDQFRFAVHEAAHALSSLALGLDLVSVSIIAEGAAGGITLMRGQLVPRLADIEARVVVTLCGRAADQVIGAGGDVGSVHDLQVATKLLAAARATHGLRDSLVHRSAEVDIESLMRMDPHLVRQVDEDLQRLMAQAVTLVEQRRDDIVKLAHALVERRFLTGEQVREVLGEELGAGLGDEDAALPENRDAEDDGVGAGPSMRPGPGE